MVSWAAGVHVHLSGNRTLYNPDILHTDICNPDICYLSFVVSMVFCEWYPELHEFMFIYLVTGHFATRTFYIQTFVILKLAIYLFVLYGVLWMVPWAAEVHVHLSVNQTLFNPDILHPDICQPWYLLSINEFSRLLCEWYPELQKSMFIYPVPGHFSTQTMNIQTFVNLDIYYLLCM